MATKNYFNAESINNVKNVNCVAAKAKNDVKNVSFMYFVNMLNKFAKKNEFCDNTNVKELLLAFREATGYNVFTSQVFEKDYAKRSCLVRAYKGSVTADDLVHGDTITDENGNELILSADGKSVRVLRPIALTRTAIIDAYKAIILPAARTADNTARAKVREEKKQARASLRAEKKQAQAAYNRGAITFAQYTAIMTKTA